MNTFLYGILFLFPIFFLPITQDAFAFQKLYLIIVVTTIIIAIGMIRVLVTKKIMWNASIISFSSFLIFLSSLASTLVSSPNKIQAIFTVPSGLTAIFFLATWSVVIIQLRPSKAWMVMKISTLFLSIIVIVSFLFHISFSPLGTYLETGIFIGFFVLCVVCELIQSPYVKRKTLVSIAFLIIYSIAGVISIQFVLKNKVMSSLPSYRMSFDIARATLAQPSTAIFGTGVDNYSSIFTRSKTSSYNTTPFWDITFAHGRSFILDMWAEIGLFGVVFFMLFIIVVYYHCTRFTTKMFFTYVVLILFLFPSSFVLLFLFFTCAGLIIEMNCHVRKKVMVETNFPIVIIGGLFSFLFILFISYIFVRVYRAEYHYSYGLVSVNNRVDEAYRHLQKAVALNPYTESYRIRLSQLYFLIADVRAKKGQEKLSKNDTHLIAQALEFGLTQAKAVIRLNPEKAMNWENLGDIYGFIVGTVNGADVWAIASYQRAIQLDPVSPRLRLKIGGMYYKTSKYEEARNYFQQAIELKSDWSNAHYNLAHVFFQEKKYQEAVNELEKTGALLVPDSAEFQKTTKELVEFKKYIQ